MHVLDVVCYWIYSLELKGRIYCRVRHDNKNIYIDVANAWFTTNDFDKELSKLIGMATLNYKGWLLQPRGVTLSYVVDVRYRNKIKPWLLPGVTITFPKELCNIS